MWDKFKKECPFVSNIPLFNLWAFKHFVEGYIEQKIEDGTLLNFNPQRGDSCNCGGVDIMDDQHLYTKCDKCGKYNILCRVKDFKLTNVKIY